MIDYTEYKGYLNADPSEVREVMRDTIGRQKTEALFEEAITVSSRNSGYVPLYSLREYENNGLPSAYQIYINSTDESEAALKLVGTYQHWRKLCSLNWFINGRPEIGFEGLARWREDMADRDKTFAKEGLILQAKAGNVTASKALHTMALADAKAAHAIRPKKGSGKKTEESQEEDQKVVDALNRFQGKDL